MTIAQLCGFYAPDFVPKGRQRYPVTPGSPGMDQAPRTVEIADARALQAAGGGTEAEVFARHSFVLLPHVTAVRDWDSEVESVYLAEIEQVIRERLFPGRRLEMPRGANMLRRGLGTSMPSYAEGVHSDGGLDADDFAHNIEAFAGSQTAQRWRARYERDDVAGLVWVNFWRVTNMARPLEHMPLALCEPTSIEPRDLIRTGMSGIPPEVPETHQVSLRFNHGQRWYYYPQMTCDELLAFKLAEIWKAPAAPGNCFHSAFRDPDAPDDAEARQSCEFRVSVLVLKE